MRKASLVVLGVLATFLASALIVGIASLASQARTIVAVCWILATLCFCLGLFGSVRATSTFPQRDGVITPTDLIRLGREYGRLYTAAGIASYLQVLFILLAVLL